MFLFSVDVNRFHISRVKSKYGLRYRNDTLGLLTFREATLSCISLPTIITSLPDQVLWYVELLHNMLRCVHSPCDWQLWLSLLLRRRRVYQSCHNVMEVSSVSRNKVQENYNDCNKQLYKAEYKYRQPPWNLIMIYIVKISRIPVCSIVYGPFLRMWHN